MSAPLVLQSVTRQTASGPQSGRRNGITVALALRLPGPQTEKRNTGRREMDGVAGDDGEAFFGGG